MSQSYKDQKGNWLYPHEVEKIGTNKFVKMINLK